MEKVYLSQKELNNNYKKFNRCLYHSDHGTVYKNCELSLNDPGFVGERISFISELQPIEGFTYPLSILCDEEHIYGYEMPFLKGYITFAELLKTPGKIYNSFLSFEQKKSLLTILHECLKKLNQQYIVGDIRLDNLMLSKSGNGVLIDWENGAPIHSGLDIFTAYEVFDNSNLIQDDAIKLFISSLSLLYGVNFEIIVRCNTLYALFDMELDSPIKEYIEDVLNSLYSRNIVYFDNYLKYLKEPSIRKLVRIKNSASKYLV